MQRERSKSCKLHKINYRKDRRLVARAGWQACRTFPRKRRGKEKGGARTARQAPKKGKTRSVCHMPIK